MQNRKKENEEELHQVLIYFLRKSSEENIFNFASKLSGSSFFSLIEILISTRYYAKLTNADPITEEFKNAKEYLKNAAPNCGSFAKGFFKFLTGIDSNLYTQQAYKTTRELQVIVKEKKDFPYIIHIYLPQHIYTILITTCHEDKPKGYIYQTNTDKDIGGEKFSIQHWINSKKNIAIDVLDHLSKVDILLDPTQNYELKKEIYEMFYTIPLSDEVITLKNLDKLVTILEGKVRWNIGNVMPNIYKRLAVLYQESIEEIYQLKLLFDIPAENDFLAMFSEKLQNEEINLEEEPNLEIALRRSLEWRKAMESNDNNNTNTAATSVAPQQISQYCKKKYRHGYSYFGGVEDSDSENEESLSKIESLEASTTIENSTNQSFSRFRTSR